MVEEQSGGRIKIDLYMGGSLASQSETFRALQTGIADIGYTGFDESPLNLVMRLPLMGYPDKWKAAQIHWDLIHKFPELEKDLQGLKILGIAGMNPEQMMFTKKEVHVPADIKGMKIIAGGDWPSVLDAAGAAAMALNPGDWYMSLERGLVEGHIINFLASFAFGTTELFKYHTIFGDSGTGLVTLGYLMNQDTWNSLPPDLQKILTDSCDWLASEVMKSDEGAQQAGIALAKDKGHTFVELTPQELQQWADLVNPVHQKWVADNANRGPSQAIYDEAVRLKEQYSQQ
jgi:TRAP-type C4-dicarboxylate transport system substrate-binding protein